MADEPETPASPEADDQVPASPATPASIEAQLQDLREGMARLEGENRTLREQLQTRPPAESSAAPPPAPVTAEVIEQAWRDGKLSDADRIQAHADLRARKVFEEQEAVRRGRDAGAAAQGRLTSYLREYPKLHDPTSDEFLRLSTRLDQLERDGFNRQDARVQAQACELAFGALPDGRAADHREYERVRRPVGGAGGGSPAVDTTSGKAKSKGERLWEQLVDDLRQDLLAYRGSKEAAIKTLEHADESRLRRQGCLK